MAIMEFNINRGRYEIDFKALREQLTDETIKDILEQFDVEPQYETPDAIIFPTCCHNLEGGSPKLYYYKDNKRFHCYTECSASFDIFTLLQKMYTLRGHNITLLEAISLCGLDIEGSCRLIQNGPNSVIDREGLRCGQIINTEHGSLFNSRDDPYKLEFKKYDKEVLRHFSFDLVGFQPWLNEGIGVEALQKFNIEYDSHRDAIIIPNFDIEGNLIGIRERFFRPEDLQRGKYRPRFWNGTLYNHPTGRSFYGIYENHKPIENNRLAIIFEGEKSVLKYGTIYGTDHNIALATLGQNITRDHIRRLFDRGVNTVILAYDSDYESYEQLKEVEARYEAKAKILAPYFNTSYLMDYGFLLPYKSSPIDGGKDAFESILKNRVLVTV